MWKINKRISKIEGDIKGINVLIEKLACDHDHTFFYGDIGKIVEECSRCGWVVEFHDNMKLARKSKITKCEAEIEKLKRFNKEE